jgi:hypothetical protein
VTAAAPAAPAVSKRADKLSRRRRASIWALIVVASLLGVVSILTTWVNRQVLSESSWRNTSRQLIEDPTIQNGLSVYLVNQLYDDVDVPGALEQRLPPNLQGLAAPLAGALRQPATRAVTRLFAAPRVQQAFVNASVLAQQKFVNVAENKTGHGISTGNGNVTLDLSETLTQVGTNFGVPASALAKLPPDAGMVTIMRSDQLSLVQNGVQAIRFLSVWLLVLVLFLYGLAIYLARGRRRETLRNAGFAFLLVGLLVVVARNLLGNYVVGTLTADPAQDDTGHRVWAISTSTLGDIGWAVVLYGVIASLGALLAGPSSAATATRRWIAPTVNNRPAIAWGGVGLAYLLLVLWGGTHALRTAWGILLLGALLAIGVAALLREMQMEFPDAGETAPPDDSVQAHAVVGRSPAAEIAHLRDLRDAGAISDAEFERGKALALRSS